jgi:hypothetical protein
MYHIELNNELIGPLSLPDLLNYDIQSETQILKDDGNSDWISAKDLPELKDLFIETEITEEYTNPIITFKLKQGDELIGVFQLEDIQFENINNETLIWTEGMSDWENAYEFLELNNPVDIEIPPVLPISEEPVSRLLNNELGIENNISDLYYIKKPNQPQLGPLSIEKILDIDVDENTLIWTEGMSNWQNAVDFLGEITSPPPLPSENGINAKKGILIASSSIFILLIMSYFAFPYFAEQENNITEKIYESYNKATVLVYNNFYYTINVEDETKLYIGIKDNEYSIFDSSNGLEPITITGTGFFTSEDGSIITNRHVAYPWKSKSNEEFQLNSPDIFSIYTLGVEHLIKQGVDISKISQSGISTFVGICENNTKINDIKDFRECTIIKHHKDFEIDIAKLQLNSKTLPKNAIKIDINRIAVTKSLVVGSDVCILGFPGGLNYQDFSEKGVDLQVIANTGEVSKQVTNYKIMYNVATAGGASGSPVFNNEGKLVGVHYSGQLGKQGFNYAILAKYILDLE